MINHTLIYDEYFDTSFLATSHLRCKAQFLNSQISHYSSLSRTRPSKQSRKEASSRAAYYIKQRDGLLNLYPEYFL